MANKIQPQNKIQILPQKLDLNWCLDKLVNGWMRIIGIEPNIPEKKDWRWILWLLQRWTCFFLSLGVNVYIVTMFPFNISPGDNTSSTLSWNEGMDYIVTSIHSISIHLLLLLVISPNWNELRIALNDVECKNRSDLSSVTEPIYPRLRNIMPLVIIAFVFSVS